ncbi:thiol reductant ABC exporter subunit CydD [Ktedonosporobacter rubrisoli]|uniref:Thiol reductant ABC exporter subunit CydD n=1 Tax=Ktedonosporobacter rubrisoli TaxID=2509675 RepID=A0A4P6JTW4_KTERU|nr:thiol reductant ABC exporter subunit CydD [Ktedonosporobacter rubrisoli]QBD78763.1 thiol reductant ABC exporter subunit CydD [Ktedonosporobacter rubrisoli]
MNISKRLMSQVPHMRGYMLGMIALAMLAGTFVVAQAFSINQIITAAFLAHQGLQQVALLLLFLLLVILGRALLSWGNEVINNRASVQAKTYLRQRLLGQLLALGPAYTRQERSGELASTFVEGTEALDAYFGQFLPQIFATACIPAIVLVAVFATDVLSGVALLLMAPVLPILLALIGKKANALNKQQWKQLSVLSAHFLDIMQGMVTLKQFGGSHAQRDTVKQVSEQFRKVTMKVLRVAFLSAFVMEMGATISMAVIAVEIGMRLLAGQMSFATAFLVLLLMPEFYQPLRMLGTRFHASMESTAAAERIFAILDEPLPASSGAACAATPALRHELRFEDVSYTYGSGAEERPVLHNVTFTLKAGKKVALVGPSGSGKSTLAALLLRFMEPTGGTILADDVPLSQMTAQAWRELVSWVPQRPYLFNTTLAENIRLGRPDAPMDEVVAAAKRARLHEFVQSLSQGYQTVIGERGLSLSGGQIQRLSLARAFLNNTPLLILDEATANLDSVNEKEVLQAMEDLMRERMTLIIAHRLHTVMQADQLVLLDKGRVVGIGTHEELLAKAGLYRQMVLAYQRKEVA